MPSTAQDTEITLGTGRMLGLFFALVMVCAVFFAVGFSLGRKVAGTGPDRPTAAQTTSPSTGVRPSAAKNDSTQSQASDQFNFYKAVEQKNADAQLTPATGAPSTSATGNPSAASQSGAQQSASGVPPAPTIPATPMAGAYYVQVAAVSRQEDADALVEALKKKQYPAFTANNSAADKFFHVQVGPFTELKDAEAMRGRLVEDGYNPIVKK